MSREVDCLVFEDQLDALAEGRLPEEGVRQLRLHADACPTCAMQLKVIEHLLGPSLEDLEARVPPGMVSSMWPGIQANLRDRAQADSESFPGLLRSRLFGGRRRSEKVSFGAPHLGWAVPALAAAAVVLLMATGFLFAELHRVKAHEQALADQLTEQAGRLAELDARTEAVARTAELTGRTAWIRALSREERVSVAQLEHMLRSVPAGSTILDAARVETLLASSSSWTPAGWKAALGALEGDGDLTVGKLLRILASADLDPRTTVSTSRLVALLN